MRITGNPTLRLFIGAALISLSPVWVKLVSVSPTVSGFYRVLIGGGALAVVGCIAGSWIIVVSLLQPLRAWRNKVKLTPAVLGMSLAHIGVGLFVLGVTMVNTFGIETDRGVGIARTVAHQLAPPDVASWQRLSNPNYSSPRGGIRPGS